MRENNLFELDNILEKAVCGISLTRTEVVYLLGLTEESQISRVFRTAWELKEQHFKDKVFLYGFIYFSTYCRNNCRFCSSRSSNKLSRRYRKSKEEIIEAACLLAESGIHMIDLTMGEDPHFFRTENEFEDLLELITRIKRETGLPLMVSPGVVPRDVLTEFAHSGVDWYACYQETHNRELFAYLRPEQNYNARLFSKMTARELGILIEEGIMTGTGESPLDIAVSTEVIRSMGAHQVRVMSFVPQTGTPMSDRNSPPRLRELLTIAVLRLLFPDRLIPASLDVDGLGLLKERLDAGANVITSLIPPRLGLSGVSQPFLGIDSEQRTTRKVMHILDRIGLAPAQPEDYIRKINTEKSALHHDPATREAAA